MTQSYSRFSFFFYTDNFTLLFLYSQRVYFIPSNRLTYPDIPSTPTQFFYLFVSTAMSLIILGVE
ncbi:hypothetical protein J3Q64DRAFT_1785761 [Phycomyces blakesleeanus]|uniref:Uncharacterized protein n=1 Tax=Phycomyces blakesleeanus TaxID=4837 RepID=A0ABR3AIN6_PHYBL